MRILILFFLLFYCYTAFTQTAGKSVLNGTYALARAENPDYTFDYEDTAATLKLGFQHQLELQKEHMEFFDSLKVITSLRMKMEKKYLSTRFRITFNSNGICKWGVWFTDKELTGNYILNNDTGIITFSYHDEKSKKNNKMYFKLLSPVSNTIMVQSSDDGKTFKPGKLTLKKQ